MGTTGSVRITVLHALLSASLAQAGTVTWDASDDRTWSGVSDATSWSGATYADGDTVVFGNTGVGAVTNTGTAAPAEVRFEHASGTYHFPYVTGKIAATGGLVLSGGGTVQFGNLANSPAALGTLLTWGGATSIGSGSQLALTRPGTLGGPGQTVTLQGGGTLLFGADNSGTYTTANPFLIGAEGGTLTARTTSNVSVFSLTGAFSGTGALTLRNEASGNNWRGLPGLRFSGASNAGFSGDLSIVSTAVQPNQFGAGAVTFGDADSLFNGASSVTIRNGGVIAFGYAMSTADLNGVTFGPRGGLGVTGAGDLKALASPMSFVGRGGVLLVDNRSNLNNDRLGNTSPLTLANQRVFLIGRDADNNRTLESVGALSVSGSGRLSLDRLKSNNSGVKLAAASMATPGAGDSLVIDCNATSDYGTSDSQVHVLVTGDKPAVENGMTSPSIQYFPGGNNLGFFMTFAGNDLVKATYTDYPGDFAAADASQIVNYTAATTTTLSGSGVLPVHGLRVSSGGDLNLGGRTIALGSGGLILTSKTISNGVLDFGARPAFIGAYNSAAQGNISAAINVSEGLTVLGVSQTLNITSSGNSITGGIFINGGSARFAGTAAKGNDVTVNVFGRLVAGSSSGSTDTIGGLRGGGTVSSWLASSGNPAGTLVIAPSQGTHAFDGVLLNGTGSPRPLNIRKEGTGTQVFGAEALGTYTGTTVIDDGLLQIDGNLANATGNVTVNDGGTLGGTGQLGGSVTVVAGGTLAATDAGSATGLQVAGNLTVAGKVGVRLPEGSRGTFVVATVSGTIDVSDATAEEQPDGYVGSFRVAGNQLLFAVAMRSGGTVILLR